MAPVPPLGPFHEPRTVDFVGASAVFLLSAALAGMSFMALAATIRWALS